MAIVEVIKYEGRPDVFAWKYPNDELGTWTQLIVNESQEAILFKGGKALDIFGSGRHTLDTANIPLLNKIVNLPFGGKSPFKAEVWFINKAYVMDIKWGTATPIQLQDPKYGIFAPLRSYGQFGIRIEDSEKFLVKLVGTLNAFDYQYITKYFRGLFLTKAKDTISSYLVHKQISLLEINAYLEEMSDYIKDKISPTLDEYGICLLNFYVNDISVPEDDTAVKKLKDALAKKAEMDIMGYDYQQERSFDTMEGAANNQGAIGSGIMGAGLGLGMGIHMGNAVGNQFAGAANQLNISTGNNIKCPSCQYILDGKSRYCPSCGYDTKKEKREKSNLVNCSNCGHDYPVNTKFCPECGNSYNPCPSCGADLSEGVTTCSTCGYELPSPCPNCNESLPKNVKFCPQCGFSLTRKCPGCNSTVNGEPKFCPECGKELQR